MEPAALIACVRAAAARQFVIEPRLLMSLTCDYRRYRVVPELNELENSVLRLIRLGKTNREIALRVSLSERSLKRLVQRLYEKLGVNCRTEAAGHPIRLTAANSKD